MFVSLFKHRKVVTERDNALSEVAELKNKVKNLQGKVEELENDKAELESRNRTLSSELLRTKTGATKAKKPTKQQPQAKISRTNDHNHRRNEEIVNDDDNFLEGMAVGAALTAMVSEPDPEPVYSAPEPAYREPEPTPTPSYNDTPSYSSPEPSSPSPSPEPSYSSSSDSFSSDF